MSNIYYWDKLTFSKLFAKVDFSKENLKKCTSFKEQNDTTYIRGNIYFSITVFSCLSSTNQCLRFLLICFAREIRGFYQSSSGNELKIAKNQNFKKLRHRARKATTLTSSSHWKTLVPFCFEKERPENPFLTLIVNYCHLLSDSLVDMICLFNMSYFS